MEGKEEVGKRENGEPMEEKRTKDGKKQGKGDREVRAEGRNEEKEGTGGKERKNWSNDFIKEKRKYAKKGRTKEGWSKNKVTEPK